MLHPEGKRTAEFVSRRKFVTTAGVTSAAAAFGGRTFAAESAAGIAATEQEQVIIGVMGLSRGLSLAKTFAETPGVAVRYLCEADEHRLMTAARALQSLTGQPVVTTDDFQDILDDPEVDALVCAAPNHWHAPAAIRACQAGKHCYVEKPCSHNPWEGEVLVAAARRHGRCVQMGNQRRSAAPIMEAIRMLHEGRIGRVYYSRSWIAGLRGPIGRGIPASVPPHVNYEIWQGPAPRRPFTTNRLHYNWHWVWHYGNGELGNNGVHSIDLSRWGLQVDYPIRVVSSGGRYRFHDDQETADTHVVSFEFEGDRQCIWEGISCNRLGMDGSSFGVSFHGEEGSMKLDSWGYTLFNQQGRETERKTGSPSDQAHIANFIEAVRSEDPSILNSEIEEGHKSTLLCHLGNIAHRTGSVLTCNPANGHIVDDQAAMGYWKREYEPGWEPTL